MKKLFIAVVLICMTLFCKAQIIDKPTLKSWFETGDKPTQEQFWHWMDSYWHKNELIPIVSITGFVPGTDSIYQRNDTLFGSKGGVEYVGAIILSPGIRAVYGVNGIHNINDSTVEADSVWIENLSFIQQILNGSNDSLIVTVTDADSIVKKTPRVVNDGDIVLIINPINTTQFSSYPNYLAQNLDGDTTTWNYIAPVNGMIVNVGHDARYKYVNTQWVFQNLPDYYNGNKNGLNIRVGTNDGFNTFIRAHGVDYIKLKPGGELDFLNLKTGDSTLPYVLQLNGVTGKVSALRSKNLVGIINGTDTTLFDTTGFAHLSISGGDGSGITQLGTSPFGLTRVNDSTYKADSSQVATVNALNGKLPYNTDIKPNNTTDASPFINALPVGSGKIYLQNSTTGILCKSQIHIPRQTELTGAGTGSGLGGTTLRFDAASIMAGGNTASVAANGTTWVLTVPAGHGLHAGDVIEMYGFTTSGFNSFPSAKIIASVTSTTLTINNTTIPAGSDNGFVGVPLVVGGDITQTSSNATIRDLIIDCNDIPGSIGYFSNSIQEMGGMEKVTIKSAMRKGVWIDGSGGTSSGVFPLNYSMNVVRVVESGSSTDTNYVAWDEWGNDVSNGRIQGITAIANGTAVNAVRFNKCNQIRSIFHVEGATNGIVIGDINSCSGFAVQSVTGNASVTNLIKIANAQNGTNGLINISGVFRNGSTNTLVDVQNNITLVGATYPYLTDYILDKNGKIMMKATGSVLGADSVYIRSLSGGIITDSVLVVNGGLVKRNAASSYLTSETDPLSVHASDSAAMLSPYLRSNVAAATYVPLTRTITINGTSQDLSTNRSWTVSSGFTYVLPVAATSNGQTVFTFSGASIPTNPYQVQVFVNGIKWDDTTGYTRTSSTQITLTATDLVIGDKVTIQY